MSTDAQKRANRKYSEKTKTFAIKYSAKDMKEAERLLNYIESENKQSVNAYIKELIKQDLDSKGY